LAAANGTLTIWRERAACGQVAPPDGLYLMRVDY
jgi:hypothetical protein